MRIRGKCTFDKFRVRENRLDRETNLTDLLTLICLPIIFIVTGNRYVPYTLSYRAQIKQTYLGPEILFRK